MIEYLDVTYEGYGCLQLKNPKLSIWITKELGPRVIGLALAGGENLMAVLPDAKIPVTNGKDYSLRGGHRLWYAPERPETTYLPDDLPVAINKINNGIEVIQIPDDPTGIQKSMKITLDEEDAEVVLEHYLTNTGAGKFTLAPWAVTMLRPGGVGLLPLQTERSDENGLWPNRQLVFWPYMDLESKHIRLRNNAVMIDADLSEGAIKIGAPNPLGWIAYALEGTLFVKSARFDEEADYLDRGASSQVYSNSTVIELETLGPVRDLLPGESILHSEVWRVYPENNWPEEIAGIFQ